MKATRVPRRISAGRNALNPRVLKAYRAAVRRYAGKPWVTGVGMGMRERDSALHPEDGLVIAIHVREKLPRAKIPKSKCVPRLIRGVPTDVVEGNYEFAAGGGAAVASAGVLRPGASIARADGSAATLGGVVVDKAGRAFLLCAMHTLREGDKGKKGDAIVSPAPRDANGAPLNVVATYDRVHVGLDAGLARLGAGLPATNDALISNETIGTPDIPNIGDILEKSGRTTGVTQAIVKEVGTFLNMFPAIHLVPLSGDVDATPLSDLGDSGAIWYDAITGRAKALHSSGSGAAPAGHEFGVATMLPFILADLKVRWATGVVIG
jgi:endonuclease G